MWFFYILVITNRGKPMKNESIREFAGVLGAIEAFLAFVCIFWYTMTPGVVITSIDAFMTMLIILSGVLLFITNFEG